MSRPMLPVRTFPRLAAVTAVVAACAAPAGASAAATPKAPKAATTVLLALRHPGGLDAFARRVSDPGSPDYRRYRSVEALVRRFGARHADRRAVVASLGRDGLDAQAGPSGTYVLAHGSAAAVDRALGTGAVAHAASATIPVPPALRGRVTSVAVLGGAPVARAAAATAAKPAAKRDPYNGLSTKAGSIVPHTGTAAGCPAGVAAQQYGLRGFTPNQYATAYGLDALRRQGLRGQGMRVAVVETDGFAPKDISTYAACFGAKTPRIRASVIGAKRLLPPGDETTLDLETLIGTLPRLSGIDVYEAAHGDVLDGIVAASAAAIGTKGRHPDVISISLGICEPLAGAGIHGVGSITAVRALDDVFALAAGSGISVLAATGDTGSSGCARILPGVVPAVQIPSVLPHVTAVGGTNITLNARNRIVRQTVWNDAPAGSAGGGGGGRSLLFDRPWWQQGPGVVGDTRRVPDVAALADPLPGYAIYCTAPACQSDRQPQGGWTTVGGTSAATPLTAAGVVLADQAAARRHQAPLGFLNPLLYRLAASKQRSSVFDDVTIGSNDIAAALSNAGAAKALTGVYDAAPGYDMATGWGSIDVRGLSRAAIRAAAARRR